MRVLLRTESEGAAERLCFTGRASGGRRYIFGGDGAFYAVCIPREGAPRITRRGELGYSLVLDSERDTDALIRTAYGFFGVKVHTLYARVRETGGGLVLECGYILRFRDYDRRSDVVFSVKPLAMREEDKEETDEN